jgi:Conserved TM helix
MGQVDVLLEPVRVVLVQVGQFLPRLALAILVLIAGWLLGRFVRFAVVKALRAVNFQVLTERAGLDGFFRQAGVATDTTAIIGILVYWLVILAALVIAFNGLGLTYITDLLGRIVVFLPRVILALVFVAFGTYFARFVGESVATYCINAGIQDADLLGKVVHYAILVFVVVIALDHMDIGGTIIRQAFLILLAGVVLALALAFGLGGQKWAAELLERWWPRHKRED